MANCGHILIDGVYVHPPVIFCDCGVADLQALKALLPAVWVLCNRVSEETVQHFSCLHKDLKAFEIIWAKGLHELWDVAQQEGVSDALHDGGHDFCSISDKLGACERVGVVFI
jgi:hypothetical protein